MAEWPHEYDNDDNARRVDPPRPKKHQICGSTLKQSLTTFKKNENTVVSDRGNAVYLIYS